MSFLININGQHEFQNLLYADTQRQLLDNFANNGDLLVKVNKLYQEWLDKQNEFERLNEITKQSAARLDFLTYQIAELDKLNLTSEELESLEKEHKQLANADKLIANIELSLGVLSEHEKNNVNSFLRQARQALQTIVNCDEKINSTIELLDNASIQVEEAVTELRHYINEIDVNPQRFSTTRTAYC